MISRRALEREAREAGQAAVVHRRNAQYGDGSPDSDQMIAGLRNAADQEERASIRASERAKMPLAQRLFTR